MQYKLLGPSQLKVSEIGYGTWGIGGVKENLLSYGPKDDTVSKAALNRSFELGVNFYDTSNSYGAGHSEELLGEVFQDRRASVILATKAGYLNTFDPQGKNQDFSRQGIEKSVAESLLRLKTDYIDLLQIHDCPIDSLNRGTLEAICELKRRGIIRATGFAGRSPVDTLKALLMFDFDSVQINFNLTDMRIIDVSLMSLCADKKIGLIVRTPLVFGFLAGKLTAESTFHPADHRNRFSKEQISKWLSAHELNNNELCQYESATPSQKALIFCLSHPAISVVNTGMNTVDQVNDNVRSTEFPKMSYKSLMRCYEVYQKNFRNE
jgi:aryl-alcohol dehydrogenase-like predicted oxidoreductase